MNKEKFISLVKPVIAVCMGLIVLGGLFMNFTKVLRAQASCHVASDCPNLSDKTKYGTCDCNDGEVKQCTAQAPPYPDPGTCWWYCPGDRTASACTDFGSCYLVEGSCVHSGFDGCALNCWDYCTECPNQGDHCSGTTYYGNCGIVCSGTKSCCSPPSTPTVTKISTNNWQVTWSKGGQGSYQDIYIGTDKTAVSNSCPNGTGPGTGCIVKDESLDVNAESYNVSGLADGTFYYFMMKESCGSASDITAYLTSCNASPSDITMEIGDTPTLVTSVNSSAEIGSVAYTAGGGVESVNPASDASYVYSTVVTGLSLGTGTVTSDVKSPAGTKVLCSSTANVTVNPRQPWWQVKDGDVSAVGDLNSDVPPGGPFFDVVGTGGYPGVPGYGGTTSLTTPKVSVTGWLANSAISSTKTYNSTYFLNAIPADVTVANGTLTEIDPGNPSIAGSTFESGGTAADGFYWYEYDGTGTDLTINSDVNVNSGEAGRKVILIVKNANLNIGGNINFTHGTTVTGSGLFMVVTTGNIVVGSGVGGGGGTPANLEGVYVADGQFESCPAGDTCDSQLWIRGSVAAYGGYSLQRDVGAALNTTTPSEVFEYAPELDLMFPSKLANYVINWREVAP